MVEHGNLHLPYTRARLPVRLSSRLQQEGDRRLQEVEVGRGK